MTTKPKLIYVPIEPLKERYTESWYRNFPILFSDAGYEVTVIDGTPLEDEVKVGAFLDINSTIHYKATQIKELSRMFNEKIIEPNTIIFVADTEFWGLESIRLMSELNQVPIKLVSFLHAASYTYEDCFAVAAPYQQYTELGWIAACDLVFVGSHYHKNAVIERRLLGMNAIHLADRIAVTGNPIFDDYPVYPEIQKTKKIVLTNRFDKEKRPNETLKLFKSVATEFPDWEFVVTTGRSTFRGSEDTSLALRYQSEGWLKIKANLSKDEYHRELASAHVMVTHSIEENYGFCIAEAINYGCYPLMRWGRSHNEFVPKDGSGKYLFTDERSARSKLLYFMQQFGTPSPLMLDTQGGSRIIENIKGLM